MPGIFPAQIDAERVGAQLANASSRLWRRQTHVGARVHTGQQEANVVNDVLFVSAALNLLANFIASKVAGELVRNAQCAQFNATVQHGDVVGRRL